MRRLLPVLAVAAALRLIAIGYGLPAAFNADEPHILNVAVSFGGGSLNPHFFKYPTLWMYLLFGAYGLMFAAWSGAGLFHTIRQFGELFVWNPTAFYLLARLLSAAAGLAALERVWRTGKLLRSENVGLYAAALLTPSPALVVAAHAVKPDSMMFLLSAWAWWFASRYWKENRSRDLVWCGLAAGLAASTQYTALPLAVLAPAAGWSKRGWKESAVWGAIAAWGVGFFTGSPFFLLDFQHFRQMLQDQRALEAMGSHAHMWLHVGGNMLRFSGSAVPGGLAWIAGAAALYRRDRSKAGMFLIPVAAYFVSLSTSSEGSWTRYLFGVYPGLALVAGIGVEEALRSLPGAFGRWPRAVLAVTLAALILPGGRDAAAYVRELALPDTRTLSAQWIEDHVRPGANILLDQEHASPRVRMSREAVERMLSQTRAAGHPRQRYYELMLSGHPGGGYGVFRLLRDPKDLHTGPGLAALSAQGQPTFDARAGLVAVRSAGIEIVVLSSSGADPRRSPELAPFFDETEREGRLLVEFSPEPGRLTGPRLRIYRIPPRADPRPEPHTGRTRFRAGNSR